MSITIWVTFVSAVLILMITPGPSHLLMLSNSLGVGFRRSVATAAGDLLANVIQMAVASFGLAGILYASQYTFTVIKWLGVCYLLYIGISLIVRNRAADLVDSDAAKSVKTLFFQGFVTSASNPKAIVFFAALFPQFLIPDSAIASQLFVLGITYLAIDALFLSAYGLLAEWIGKQFKDKVANRLDRISGSLLIGTAILLGLKKVDV